MLLQVLVYTAVRTKTALIASETQDLVSEKHSHIQEAGESCTGVVLPLFHYLDQIMAYDAMHICAAAGCNGEVCLLPGPPLCDSTVVCCGCWEPTRPSCGQYQVCDAKFPCCTHVFL